VISVYRERALLVFPKDWDLESLEKRREHPIGRTENTEETYECNAMKWFCLRACSGTSRSTVSGGIPESSCGLKLNSGGSGRPFGRRAFGSLSSSKKGWIQASTAVHLKLGEYWKNLQRRSTASGGRRFWNT
jgi:hypothetical protein